jgi:hypothetical protein
MIRLEFVTAAVGVGDAVSIVWDLSDGRRRELAANGSVVREAAGPYVLVDGVEGLGHPQWEVSGLETVRRDGRRRTGQRAKPRSGFLPVVFFDEGADWHAVSKLFWRCVNVRNDFVWRVTGADGDVRELTCRLDPSQVSYGSDPSLEVQAEPVDIVADDPFWRGVSQTALVVVEGDGISFFGPAQNAPPFYIGPSTVSGSSRFEVDGDLEAWPVLELVGPILDWSVSDGNGGIVGGLALLEGDRVVIDFDPTVQAAIRTRDGVESNVTDLLPNAEFFQLVADPLGGMDVDVYLAGTGSLTINYQARYWRAI